MSSFNYVVVYSFLFLHMKYSFSIKDAGGIQKVKGHMH